MVHFCARISDNLDVLGEKVIAVLSYRQLDSIEHNSSAARYDAGHLQDQKEPGTMQISAIESSLRSDGRSLKVTYCLLLREITGSTKDHDDRVLLELHCPAKFQG